MIIDGIAKLQPNGQIMLGPAPGAPGAAPADAAKMKGGSAPVAKDDAKAAPPPKS